MKLFHCARLLAAAFVLATAGAHAVDRTFQGTITYHNDVAYVGFNLEADTPLLKIWTDSFQGGVNMDPIITLWSPILGDLERVAYNDDNRHVGPGQTIYDSGLVLHGLQAGFYMVSIVTFDNFARGTLLSQGFRHDGDTPILIGDWTDGSTGFWRLHVSSVPEPQTYALLLAGLGVMGMLARRRRA